MNKEEKEIYEYAAQILRNERDIDFSHKWNYKHTERCIEVPWVARCLNNYEVKSLLDIGFTFASHDYLRLILDFSIDHSLSGVDIINPEQVEKRYPIEWIKDIKNINFYNMDISQSAIKDKKFDAVTLISTIEHIGFDKKSETVKGSSFERENRKEKVIKKRDLDIEAKVLNNVSKMMSTGGIVLVSVPCGKGGPIIVQDSLGLYTCYYEYNTESLNKIKQVEGFSCVDEKYFIEDVEGMWSEREFADELLSVTAELKNHVVGVACLVLKKD